MVIPLHSIQKENQSGSIFPPEHAPTRIPSVWGQQSFNLKLSSCVWLREIVLSSGVDERRYQSAFTTQEAPKL